MPQRTIVCGNFITGLPLSLVEMFIYPTTLIESVLALFEEMIKNEWN